jgi:hypothetical protein
MTTHWLLRIGDGENFKNSLKYKIWGIRSTTPDNKYFLTNVKSGDKLWFVKSNSHGKLLAVSSYLSHNKRELGPLLNITMSNEELGWIGNGPYDVEIHYNNLYGLDDCELLTHINGPKTIRKYNEKCRINLETEYNYIIKYSKITFEL